MLNELFSRAHTRLSSLPLLGPIAAGFADWLEQQGYRRGSARHYLRTLTRLDDAFRQRGRTALRDVTRKDLRACLPPNSQDDRNLAGTVHALERYLDKKRFFLLRAPNRWVELPFSSASIRPSWRMSGDSPPRQLQAICVQPRAFLSRWGMGAIPLRWQA